MKLSSCLRLLGVVALVPAVVTGALLLSLDAAAEEEAKVVTVRWYGQACFELDFPGGLVALVDPFKSDMGYQFPKDVKPDVVTISHEHGDHNNDKDVAGSPKVLRGLTSEDTKTQDWKDHDVKMKGVRIRSVRTFHDEKEGKERGKNAVFVFEPEEKDAFATIVHLGDLGHKLTDGQLKAIGVVDAVLVPVGGKFTIDAKAAKEVCEQLKPSHFIYPMHYKTRVLKFDLATVDDFTVLFDDRVRRVDGNEDQVTPLGRGSWPKEKGTAPYVRVLGFEAKAPADSARKTSKPVEQPDPSPRVGLGIDNMRAWRDRQPKAGKTDPELHLAVDLGVAGGTKGATVRIEAELQKDGKKIATLELVDEGNGEVQPEGGFQVSARARRILQIAVKEGQTAPKGAKVVLDATVKEKGAGTGSPNHFEVDVQDVD